MFGDLYLYVWFFNREILPLILLNHSIKSLNYKVKGELSFHYNNNKFRVIKIIVDTVTRYPIDTGKF